MRRIVPAMRILFATCCLGAFLVPLGHAAPGTWLTITYDPDSRTAGKRTRWTLGCSPTRGTHPRRVAVCRDLGRVGWRAFRPVLGDRACAELYGGPQVAIVSGSVDGRRVWARLSRTDGCEIERWNRIPPLLPKGGVP